MQRRHRRRFDERWFLIAIPLVGIAALFFFEWLGQPQPLKMVETPVIAPKHKY